MTTDRLPAHVRRDLDRAARGEGRVPTTAHPDCRCVTTRVTEGGTEVREITGRSRASCPQHRPERGSDG